MTVNEEIPIIVFCEGLNNNIPLIIIELEKDNENMKLNIKVRHITNTLNNIKEKYFTLKTKIKNPLLVVNASIYEIQHNPYIKKSISEYYKNNQL